jgi:Tfp pilus assembly protein PilF
MSDDFFIPEERLATLKATPAGRSGDGGYNYQRAYGVARLAGMGTAEPVLGLPDDYPRLLRYDWAEDLDEVLSDGSVCFTQCKQVDHIGEPAKLAQVLLGFAPKWLWTPEAKRAQVRFRLVSCDPRFLHDFKKDTVRDEVLANFKSQLAAAPSAQSDRAKWQNEAGSAGHDQLFDALWRPLDLVYVAKEVVPNQPAGELLRAELLALDHLMRWSVIWGDTQKDALALLRRLLHENLIAFDPANQTEPALPKRPPQILAAADVRIPLLAKGKDAQGPPFAVVDRIYLADARTVVREQFLFEAPEWYHVVHGADEKLRFVERDQTPALAQTVRERLIAPLRRGTGNLSALFVTGPPGAGKSTLVRRVAAQLIEAGEVVVADAGHNLANIVPGGVEPYVKHLIKFAQQGRPVLLVLDDPLSAESEWIELIKHLKQPGLQLAVIAPTPDFLYHSHQHELRGVQIHTFKVNPPSAAERQALTRLYRRALNENETLPDDFLVMVAEAAEGKPFPEIMQRLWATLNGGQNISGDVSFKDLPWRVRAFWFVCALHRAYTPCPLPILREALDMSGGTGNLDVPTALAELKVKRGWSIFRILQPASAMFRSTGELVSTAHQKIASAAWEKRPGACLEGACLDGEVNRLLAAATLRAPASVLYVAAAAGTLSKAESNPDSMLADELIQQWAEAAPKDQNLETRNLYALAASLMTSGGRELVQRMLPSLQQRANGRDGWLAALQLRYLSADKEPERSFPYSINLGTLIADADFSMSPRRAIRFFDAVKDKAHREAILSRLCASLNGTLAWQIDSTLLVWLISHAPVSEMVRFLHRVHEWLDGHKEDTSVRTQYLIFLMKLPAKFDKHRKNATTFTENWLEAHDDDTRVRTQYLAFLMKLPAKFDKHRKQAVIDTAKWLADSRHDYDTAVRTQYLAFLQQLPPESDEMRKQAALKTAKWLKKHPENFDVCTGYVGLLLAVRHTDLAALEAESIPYHQWIIAKNPKQVGHRFTFGEQLLRLEKYAEAKAEYEQVLAREPRHQLALRGLAIALQNLGEAKRAEDAFKRALYWAQESGGHLARFHTPLGVFYLSEKRWPEAIKSFAAAGNECPEYYGNHWGIAKAQIGLGKLAEAGQSLEQALADPGLRPPAKDEIEQMLADISQRITARPEG